MERYAVGSFRWSVGSDLGPRRRRCVVGVGYGSSGELASVGSRVHCPSSWSYFSNRPMHYGFCYPPGWGFQGDDIARPAPFLYEFQVDSLRLLSPGAFPEPREGYLTDVMRARGIVDLELMIFPSHADVGRECFPHDPIHVAGANSLWCSNRFDQGGPGRASDETVVTSRGEFIIVKVLIPLKSVPLNVRSRDGSIDHLSQHGDRLLVVFMTTAERYQRSSAQLWEIVRSIRMF